MIKEDRTGMLFFLFNSEVIAVLVCHDIQEGEFVLQVPFFPPVENLSDYDNKRCLEIVKKSIFPDKDPRANSSKIEIKSVNSWKMEAVVAESFINK